MRIALAQQNYHIGDFPGNAGKIKAGILAAKAGGADLVVFPELAVSGYPPRDFLEFKDFVDQCLETVQMLAAECQGIAAIVGGPAHNESGQGKPLYNAAFFLEAGRIQAIRYKSLLPNYDIFDEYRYFEPNPAFSVVPFKSKRLAITICEDLWMEGIYPLYTVDPMDALMPQRPDLIVNLAASPYHAGQWDRREHVFRANALKYGLPVLYVNHVGAQTELIFDGGSLVMGADGKVKKRARFFEEDMLFYDTEERLAGISVPLPNDRLEALYHALVLGIRDYFGKLGFGKAILGLSGGIDSALVAVLAARALGSGNVRAILMPSGYSSAHSVTDSVVLAKNLGISYEILPIEDCFRQFSTDLQPLFGDLPFNIAEENLQARVRAVFLMALSNKFGPILLNTSNKSEAAVGYGTLYGDMCGGLAVLGDLYKTEVYALSRWINRGHTLIPDAILDKAPSAELRPGQKDSDSLPEYSVLDPLLYAYIEERRSPRELEAMGFDPQLVKRVLKLVNTNEYKRYQTPPILRVSSKAFGTGRRMPIVAKYLSQV